MSALIHLDFVEPRPRRPLLSALVLLIGVLSLTAAGLAWRAVEQRRAGVALQLEARASAHQLSPESQARAARDSALSAQTVQELSTPWTELLAELEAASKDAAGDVAVLAVEPDHEKHKVRVNGESQSLALAIAYVQRLQRSGALRYPMLDSHEVKPNDPQHPVRFELTAEWRDGS